VLRRKRATWTLMSGVALAATVAGAVSPSLTGARAATPAHITYTYPYFTTSAPRDLAAVQNAINAITTKLINTQVTLNPLAGGSFDQKMQLQFSAGQSCDVVFTAPWINNFYQLVTNGDLLPLNTLLPRLAPKTYASLAPSIWQAAAVNGQIYGVINQQMFPKTWGIEVRKDLAVKDKIDLSHVHGLDDVTAVLAKAALQNKRFYHWGWRA